MHDELSRGGNGWRRNNSEAAEELSRSEHFLNFIATKIFSDSQLLGTESANAG